MKNKGWSGAKQIWLYLASAGIPCCIMIVAMAFLKCVPFGDRTLLFSDSMNQYISYMGYVKTIFSGENDIFYTFNKNLGGDVISLASYYLMSPFNLLFAFSSIEKLPLMYTVVMVLKVSLCGFSYYYTTSRIWGCKASGLLFSTAYALTAYNTIFVWNVMWLDGVIILPVLALGVYQIWNCERKYGAYIFAIAYGLFTNFYIGYMLCATSVIFSLACLYMDNRELKEKKRIFGEYLLASCIGGFSVAVVWLPAFLSLRSGRADFYGDWLAITPQLNLPAFTAKFVAGTASTKELLIGMPHVFCGMAVLLLMLVFLGSKRIEKKKRIAALVTVLIFLISFCIKELDIIWHGFSPNRCFNFRYSFAFSYVMIVIAHYTLHKWELIDRRTVLIAGLLVAGVLAVAWLKQGDVSLLGLCISAGVLLMTCVCLLTQDRARGLMSTVLILLTVFEMGANCWISWDRMIKDTYERLYYSQYCNFLQKSKPVVDYVQQRDPGFYRMEKTFSQNRNDPMTLNYNGLTHFSSAEKIFVMEFMEKMGFKNYWGIWAHYNTGSTAEVDSLLGVKYVLSEQDLSVPKGFRKIEEINGVGIYENPNALSVAFLSDPDIAHVSMENPDYFALHNDIWRGILGEESGILTRETQYTVTVTNLKDTPLEEGSRRYEKIDAQLPASICYEITVSQEKPLYFYFTADIDEQDVNVFVNGEDRGPYFGTYRWDMSNAGIYPEGEKVTIELVCNKDTMIMEQEYFYYEDLRALKNAAAAVRENTVTMERHSSSHFTGHFESDAERQLVVTVPYERGWKVLLDGKQVETGKVLDTLLAVDVGEGVHEFELRYIPRGIYAGCGLTVLSVVLVLLLYKRRPRVG